MASCRQPTADSSMSLSCPLCLEVFKDATVLMGCGHSFCRRCLRRYDRAHRDLDHMVCPLCRKVTKWEDGRVNDLPSNAAVNNAVADCKDRFGINARLRNVKCSECKLGLKASFFCKTCSAFMCHDCRESHTSTCEGQDVTSVKEILEDIKRSNPSVEDTQEDVQDKIDDLLERGTATIDALKSVDDIETVRDEIHAAVDKLREEVRLAYESHTKQLKEDHCRLVEEMDALELGVNDDL